MASHRIGARVSGLSPEQLCDIIEAQAGASAAALRVAEEHAARLVEQPEWILSEVLLSPDLAPHILAQLPTKEHAVKGTCRAWRRGWKETLKKRERPRMLVVGGIGADGDYLTSMVRHDPASNAWAEEDLAPMLTARKEFGMAVLDGKLYTVGGESPEGLSLNLVERYDPATNAWEAAAPLAGPSHNQGEDPDDIGRIGHGMAVLDGKLYAVGGDNSYGLSSVERYDPAQDAWELVAPMATMRDMVGVAVLDGKLYAVGGYGPNDNDLFASLSSVERYDAATNAWEAVAPMESARNASGVAVLEGKLYVAGGYNDDGYLSSVERYDPALDAWEVVAPMATARAHLTAAVLDGKLYAVGGEDGDDYLSSVERYDPSSNAWEAVAPMAMARTCHSAALL